MNALETKQFTKEGAAVFKRAQSLSNKISEHAEGNESAGQLSPEIVKELQEGNFFALFAPKAVGGWELTPVEALCVIEELARADGPTAWVVFAAGLAVAAAGAYLKDGPVKDMFGASMPIIAGQGIPNGKAQRVKGGWRLSGKWSYGSGVKHASVVHTGALTYEDGELIKDGTGMPETRIFHLPRDQVKFSDNWDVVGLRATGSIDYAIDDVFVADDYTYAARVTKPFRGGGVFHMGTIGIGAIGHTAFALGAGRRMLDELSAFARSRAGAPGSLGASESFLERFAESEAKLRAARALAMESWESAQDGLLRGEPSSTRDITLVRLALNHATWTASAVCDFAYNAAGGASLRNGVMQRTWRDMHAATQHVTSSPQLLRECGRDLVGFAEGKHWGFMGLINDAR